MKRFNRILSLLLVLAMLLSVLPMVSAVDELEPEEIVILFTNDIHTYIANEGLRYSNVADLKNSLLEDGQNVLLVDAGDHVQGTAYGSMDKGATIIELMNGAGYDLATLGNHEFDYGMERALELVGMADFSYVSANFYHEENGVKGEPVLAPYELFEMGGKKIAFVGITTPETFTKSTPAYFQDEEGNYIYGISGGEDGAALYADVQAAIDAAKAEADYVIALGHLGDDPASKPWTSEELIANTTGLDAFIDGHSHSTVEGKEVADKDGNKVLLTQSGEYLKAIGMMTIGSEGIKTQLITEFAGVNADVKAIEDAWISEIDEKLGEVIGYSEVTLDNYDAEGNRLVRKQETNTGDFAADALYYLFDNMDMDVDVAIMNGGGIRNQAITGDISYLTCKKIHTFGNVACLQTVTGQQILDALEWGARETPLAEVGGFLHVAGMTYEVDASIESTVQKDEKGIWVGGPTGEYRVKNVKIYDKESQEYVALDPEAKYNMAGYNYTLRDLGDGFAMFDGAVNVLDYVMEDYQVLANYVKAFHKWEGIMPRISTTTTPLYHDYPNMLINYEDINGAGRIKIVNIPEEEWDGVIVIGGLEPNLWTTKYGNVYTNCTAENFTEDLGLAWGDLATVKFLDKELILPVVPDYSYVDSGKPALLVDKNEQGNPTGYAFMAINMGNFLDTYGIAYKGTDADGNWFWTAYEGVEFPIVVTFELYEKEGYMAEYLLHELSRTNNREDYAELTDEEFANFREVTTTGMGDDTLYRSSSPINPEIGRNTYADAAAKAAGVKTFVNLADSEEEAAKYEGFAESYYAQQNVKYLCLGVDFAAEDFQKGLAEGLRFIIANEGPYLVHCTEGKDRAGFVNAILECFMGASYEEVIEDYMVTYYNYYGVEPGTEKYEAIAESNIIKSLKTAFGVEDLTTADLAAEAEEYLAAIGLTGEEIEELFVALGGELPDPYAPVLEKVQVPSTVREGTMIPTYVTLPAEYNPAVSWPVVFMLHGHGGNHNEWGGYDYISNNLAYGGMIVVTIDFPGCDASTESFTLNTMTNMKQDVLDVVNYVFKNYTIDEDMVGGFGYSMGGRIILEMIAEGFDEFDAIELVAPAEDFEDLKLLFGGPEKWEEMKAEAEKNGFVEFTTVYGQVQQLSKEWFADLAKYPDGLVEKAAEKYDGESLVIWATDDEAVSPKVSATVADVLNSATLQTYTGGHSYSFYNNDEYVCRITNEGSIHFFISELYTDVEGPFGYIHEIREDGSIVFTIEAEKLEGLKKGDKVKVYMGGRTEEYTFGKDLVIENGVVVLNGNAVEKFELASKDEKGNWIYDEDIAVPAMADLIFYTNPFTDVPSDAWYTEYVLMMANAGLIKGKTSTTFAPEDNITRAEFATLLYRMVGEPEVEGMTEPFSDVSEKDWFYKEVVWAYNAGVITGVTKTSFAPNKNVTREQVATMLYRFSKDIGVDMSEIQDTNILSYEDATSVSTYAVEPITWAVGAGMINGTTRPGSSNIYLDPQGNATRAQAAKILVQWVVYLENILQA